MRRARGAAVHAPRDHRHRRVAVAVPQHRLPNEHAVRLDVRVLRPAVAAAAPAAAEPSAAEPAAERAESVASATAASAATVAATVTAAAVAASAIAAAVATAIAAANPIPTGFSFPVLSARMGF